MKKMYAIVDYMKEVKDDQQQAIFTGTHGKHGTKTGSSVGKKQVKMSRLVVDDDYLTKSAFVKEATKVAKELDGRVKLIGYFAN